MNCKCGNKGTHVCKTCKKATYCSRDCQRGDWPEHKKACAPALLCGICAQPREPIESEMMSCCATTVHGMCLARLRLDGLHCSTCDDELPPAPEILYEKATTASQRIKHLVSRKKADPTLVDQVLEVHELHLSAAKQGHPSAQMRLYETYLNGEIVPKDEEAAMYWLKRAADKLPVCMESASAKIKLGETLAVLGEHEQAKKSYYGALFFYSTLHEQVGAHKGVENTCAKLFNRIGHLLRLQEKFPEATKFFQQAVVFGESVAAHHHDLAIQLTTNEDYQGAEDEYRRCLVLNNNCGSAHRNLGLLLAKRGEAKSAAIHFQKSVKLG